LFNILNSFQHLTITFVRPKTSHFVKNISLLMFSSRFLYRPKILVTNLPFACFLLLICLFLFCLYFRRCTPVPLRPTLYQSAQDLSITILPSVTNLALNLQFWKLSEVKLLSWYINTFSRSSDDIWYPFSEISECDSSPSTILTTKFVPEI